MAHFGDSVTCNRKTSTYKLIGLDKTGKNVSYLKSHLLCIAIF